MGPLFGPLALGADLVPVHEAVLDLVIMSTFSSQLPFLDEAVDLMYSFLKYVERSHYGLTLFFRVWPIPLPD